MKNIVLIFVILIFASCNDKSKKNTEKEKSFKLIGKIDGSYSDYIYLNYGDIKDSTKVENNSFKFNGTVERPVHGWLNLKPDANMAWLYIENSDISINLEHKTIIQNGKQINILDITDIKGSYSANIKKEYQKFYQVNKSKENFQELLFNKLDTFLSTNKNHPFSGAILAENALISPVLNRNELLKLYSKIDTNKQKKDDLEMFKMGIANLNKYSIDKPIYKFTLPNTKGKKIDISKYLGSITLIDFWASWCAPCRAKHPELIELKEKFENSSFEIVSISIDDNKESWLKAVKKDNLKWTNLIDENKEVNDELGIQAIPFNYLIDEKGIILGVNLSIENIDAILNEKVGK